MGKFITKSRNRKNNKVVGKDKRNKKDRRVKKQQEFEKRKESRKNKDNKKNNNNKNIEKKAINFSIKDTLSYLDKKLSEKNRVFFSRFGDNDLCHITGKVRKERIGNNQTVFTKELQKELYEAINIESEDNKKVFLKGVNLNENNSVYSNYINSVKNIKNTLHAGCFNRGIFHFPDKIFNILKRHFWGKKILYIGSVENIEKLIGGVSFYVETPLKNSYSEVETIWHNVKNILDNNDIDMIICNTGQLGRVLQKRIWYNYPENEFHCIDIGSFVDALDNKKTRGYLRNSINTVQNNIDKIINEEYEETDVQMVNNNDNVTAILLNWKRPENLKNVIKSIRDQNLNTKIWLWNNNPNIKENFDVDFQINSVENFMCWPRWLLASLVNTEYFFVIDDDIKFNSNDALETLLEVHSDYYNGKNNVIVGPHAQNVNRNLKNPYTGGQGMGAHNVINDTYVDVIKGRCMFMNTSIINKIPMEYEDRVEDIKISSFSDINISSPKLKNKFESLNEGSVSLYTQPEHNPARDKATKKYFKI